MPWHRRWCSYMRRCALRGRIIGVFTMSSLGLRFFSGMSVGLLGGVVGIHLSLTLAAVSLLAVVATRLADPQ